MRTPHRRSPLLIARQLRQYKPGEKVKVLRGSLAGKIMTIRAATDAYVVFIETNRREAMSKYNVEPEAGFTREELNQASLSVSD